MSVQTIQRMTCAALRANMTVHQYGSMFNIRPSGSSALIADSHINHFQSCQHSVNLTDKKRNFNLLTAMNSIGFINKTGVIGAELNIVKSIVLSSYKYFNGLGKSDFKQGKQNSVPEIEAKCGLPGQNMTCRREVASAHIYRQAVNDFRSKFTILAIHAVII